MSQQFGAIFSNVGATVGTEATDPNTPATDPNQTPALAPRMFRAKANEYLQQLAVFVADGTSLVVEVWIYDETTANGRWWRVGTATILAGASQTFQAYPGAKTFVRIVTNNGTVANYMIAQL